MTIYSKKVVTCLALDKLTENKKKKLEELLSADGGRLVLFPSSIDFDLDYNLIKIYHEDLGWMNVETLGNISPDDTLIYAEIVKDDKGNYVVTIEAKAVREDYRKPQRRQGYQRKPYQRERI